MHQYTKMQIPGKGIQLTRLILFEVLEMLQLSGTSLYAILAGMAPKFVISSKNIQLLQSYIVIYRKKLEEVVFVEEFLQKISNKDVYVNYGVRADIPEDAVKQYGDLTALK